METLKIKNHTFNTTLTDEGMKVHISALPGVDGVIIINGETALEALTASGVMMQTLYCLLVMETNVRDWDNAYWPDEKSDLPMDVGLMDQTFCRRIRDLVGDVIPGIDMTLRLEPDEMLGYCTLYCDNKQVCSGTLEEVMQTPIYEMRPDIRR